jgi:4,5-dihydroxyphthalate decarboxylase
MATKKKPKKSIARRSAQAAQRRSRRSPDKRRLRAAPLSRPAKKAKKSKTKIERPGQWADTTAAKPAKKSTAASRSPGKLRLTIMTGNYEIVRALKDGTVQAKGIELVGGGYPGTRAIHARVAEGEACDINEFNGGHYVVQKAHGRADITALPVFLHRRFRHGFIYVNKAKASNPADLVGKRIGSYGIGAAANYWMRGYLEEFGVPHRDCTWVVDRLDETTKHAPKELKVEQAPKGRTVEQMLLDGEIEGMISPSVTRMIGEKDPRVGRLWPNYQDVEKEYFRRTGFFPIMHVTTIPTKIVEKHPWVVESLTLAFEEAKQLAYQRLVNPRNVPLAFFRTYWEEERELLGDDPWEYGLSDLNKRNYDQLVGYVHDQVLTGPRPKLEDLFPKQAFELKLPLPKLHDIEYGF